MERHQRRTAHQDVMNLTSLSRVLNHGTQLYLYTMHRAFLVLQTHFIIDYLLTSFVTHCLYYISMFCSRAIPGLIYALRTSNPMHAVYIARPIHQWLVPQTMYRCLPGNPWIAQIHALRVTYARRYAYSYRQGF